jgi:hypothetical protein
MTADDSHPGSFAVRPTTYSGMSNSFIDLTTCFSSEDVWRGACASKRRDRRLHLLQALVRHPTPLMATPGAPALH